MLNEGNKSNSFNTLYLRLGSIEIWCFSVKFIVMLFLKGYLFSSFDIQCYYKFSVLLTCKENDFYENKVSENILKYFHSYYIVLSFFKFYMSIYK